MDGWQKKKKKISWVILSCLGKGSLEQAVKVFRLGPINFEKKFWKEKKKTQNTETTVKQAKL